MNVNRTYPGSSGRCGNVLPFTALVLMCVLACERYPPEPEKRIDRTHLQIIQTGFDSVRISDDWGVKRSNRDVDRISFGTVEGGIYAEKVDLDPVWVETDSAYHLRFTATIEVPFVYFGESYATIRARFYIISGGWFDYDEVVRTDTFPYEGSETVVTPSAFPVSVSLRGIGVLQDRIFTRQVGDPRIFWIDLSTHMAADVVSYPGIPYSAPYYVLTAGGGYMFATFDGNYICRWNAATAEFDTTIKKFEVSEKNAIRGLAVSHGTLYALLIPELTDSSTLLVTMDFDGRTIDSVGTWDMTSRHIAISDSILFIVKYGDSEKVIRRFSLTTMSELTPLLPPAPAVEGIAVFGQWFYYADSWRESIRRVRLTDLRTIGD